MLRSFAVTLLLGSLIVPAYGQGSFNAGNTGRATPGGQPAARGQAGGAAGAQLAPVTMSPELEKILTEWSIASSRIETLEGDHIQRVYDLQLGLEVISEGHFWYERPDKGRIDIEPTPVTMQMVDDRKSGKTPARRIQNKDGVELPFELRPGKAEKWICDGQRVFQLQVEEKSAGIVNLPTEMMGQNIMDSPMPFLFGMPPEKAKERFRMELFRETDRQNGRAYIRAYPRTARDSGWQMAEIILDIRSFLPIAVQLSLNGESQKCFAFGHIKVNQTKTLWTELTGGGRVFVPNLKGFQVVVEGSTPTVPNLIGLSHTDALEALEKLGLPRDKDNPARNRVSVLPGPAARSPQDIYKVALQLPAPGTPIKNDTTVELKLFMDPRSAKK
ncbi:MAG: PASTA domain-containing protein [Planctomycetaceae bacterium]|nr:PASTA domain-containing protein [Planctomycetaceae bacterium]